MSAAVPDDLPAVLEQCRAHRGALTRDSSLPPDSLHRVLRCTRCRQWNLDTRVYQGFLQVADGGARPCWSVDELRSFVASQHLALHKTDRLDACRCGAPAVCLSLAAARFIHAMPGSGAELLAEVHYQDEGVASLRFGRSVVGGAVTFLEDASEAVIHAVFGVPLTVWAAWRDVIAVEDGGIVAIEEGHALAAFPATSEAFRAQFEEALRDEPELRAYGLSPRITADPSWQWLRSDANLLARPGTVLVTMLRHDVLAARIAALTAVRGIGARRDGDTVWVEDGLARWPVELPTVAEEGFRRGFSLSTMAAAAVAHARERIETLHTFIGAIEKLRPGVTFTVNGMQLVPSRDGVTGRAMDLRVAPFGPIPDPETLDRDLRFHLQEGPAWSDPWRVCPCGAARTVSMHRWRPDDLATLVSPPSDLLRTDDGDDGSGTVRVFAVSCERHVDYALGPLLAARPRTLASLRSQAALDLDRQCFAINVATYADASGRAAALVECPTLMDATVDPALVAGLVNAALQRGTAATVTTVSRELAVVAETGADAALVAQLEEVGRVLWTVQRGSPPTPLRAVFASDAATPAAGAFLRVENGSAAGAGPAGSVIASRG